MCWLRWERRSLSEKNFIVISSLEFFWVQIQTSSIEFVFGLVISVNWQWSIWVLETFIRWLTVCMFRWFSWTYTQLSHLPKDSGQSWHDGIFMFRQRCVLYWGKGNVESHQRLLVLSYQNLQSPCQFSSASIAAFTCTWLLKFMCICLIGTSPQHVQKLFLTQNWCMRSPYALLHFETIHVTPFTRNVGFFTCTRGIQWMRIQTSFCYIHL